MITSKTVKKWLAKIDCDELTELVETYPEEERDGRTDAELLYEELELCLSMYEEDGYYMHDDLCSARRILRQTKNGKRIPIGHDQKPLPGYTPQDISYAKHIVHEYNAMKYRYAQLTKVFSGIHYQALQHHSDDDRTWFFDLSEEELAALNQLCNALVDDLPVYAKDLLEVEYYRDPDAYDPADDSLYGKLYDKTDHDYLLDDEIGFDVWTA